MSNPLTATMPGSSQPRAESSSNEDGSCGESRIATHSTPVLLGTAVSVVRLAGLLHASRGLRTSTFGRGWILLPIRASSPGEFVHVNGFSAREHRGQQQMIVVGPRCALVGQSCRATTTHFYDGDRSRACTMAIGAPSSGRLRTRPSRAPLRPGFSQWGRSIFAAHRHRSPVATFSLKPRM